MSDYISREEFENLINPYDTYDSMDKALYNFAHNNLICCPSADVRENVHGEWINAKVGKLFPSNDFKCSICGNILNFDGLNCGRGDANFCPNCGADMRGKAK